MNLDQKCTHANDNKYSEFDTKTNCKSAVLSQWAQKHIPQRPEVDYINTLFN